jgi:hypothetical protein
MAAAWSWISWSFEMGAELTTRPSGTASNALTTNMTALRRYHRRVYELAQGCQTLTGTVATSTSLAAVTGAGTRFLSELFVGAQLMAADGETVIGYVDAIADDTHATLLSNAAQAHSGAATIVPQLGWMAFGDSTAELKARFIVEQAARALGATGYYGRHTYDAATGTVTINDGDSVPYDYTYSPTGKTVLLSASSSITFGIGGGPFNGNVFKVYYAKGPGLGQARIKLIDAWDEVYASQTADASAPGVALGVAVFNLGGSPARRRIRVSTAAGSTFRIIGVLFQNTTVPGIVQLRLNRAGLSLANVVGTDAGVAAGLIGDLMPVFATYEMREDGAAEVAANLPQAMARLTDQWSAIDWLFYGQTPGSRDAGLSPPVAPSWQENEAIRAYALANGHAFFDGYTPCGSYENVLALQPDFDGNHVNEMWSHYLAALVMRQFGLLDFALVPEAPLAINAGKIRGTRVSVNRNQDAGFTPDAGYLESDNFGIDVFYRHQRWGAFTDISGTRRAMLWSTNPSHGLGVIISGDPWHGFLDDATRYNPNDWSIQVSDAGVVTLKGKDGSGTFKSLALGTLA